MRAPLRRWIWVAATIGLPVLALFLLLPRLVDPNRYRGLIEERAEALLGRDVSLGEIRVSFVPLGLRVRDVAVRNLPEEGDGDLLTAAAIHVGARLGPLLRRRLEVSSISIEEPEMTLRRSASGVWNVQRLLAEEPVSGANAEVAEPLAFSVDRLSLRDGLLRLRVEISKEDAPLDLALENLEVRLSRLAPGEVAKLEVHCDLGAGRETSIDFVGSLGPLFNRREDGRLEGEIRAERLSTDLLTEIARIGGVEIQEALFERSPGVSAKLGLELADGAMLEISDVVVSDLDLRFKRHSDGHLNFALEGRQEPGRREETSFALEGLRIERSRMEWLDSTSSPPLQVALEELEVSLDRLAAGEYGRFTARAALARDGEEASLSINGRVALLGEQAPAADLHISLDGFPGTPIEDLSANVVLEDQRLQVNDFGAVIGDSDLGGTLAVEEFSPLRVDFDLRSERLRFEDLLALVDDRDSEDEARGAAEGREADSVDLHAQGVIAIEEGSWGDLEFSQSMARVVLDGRVLTLEPISVSLYEGSFSGRLVTEIGSEALTFDLRGEATDIDTAAFLAANLGVEDTVAGRFSGRISTRGSPGDYEELIASLEGEGTMALREGRLGGLEILRSVAKVSGVFGQHTLGSLADSLADSFTDFQSLESRFRLSSGTMILEDVVLKAPHFELRGSGAVDLLESQLKADGSMVLSAELSQRMVEEGGRAVELFWDESSRRVALPLTMSGRFDEVATSVDWGQATTSYARRRVETEVRGLLKRLVGGADEETDRLAAATGDSRRPDSAPPSADLTADIERPRWGSSLLAQDLELRGSVSGPDIAEASLRVLDARGSEIERFEPLSEVAAWVQEADDRSQPARIGWRAEIDGKALLLARFPLTVELTVTNDAGESAIASRTVDR